MKKLFVVTVVVLLTGCGSEVDKCVDAYMKSADDYWRREGITGEELQSKRLSELAVKRRVCMEAASGKRN